MVYYVVIPAYNEADYIKLTLDSLVSQTRLPARVVVVDDNSTDETSKTVSAYAEKYAFIDLINKESEHIHLPGSKVINAFQEGVKQLDQHYDILVKLDADIILPKNYFEVIINAFEGNSRLGMAGGFAYIEKNGDWILENLTDKDHIRGAFKAYRKECLEQIGGLKPAMGWDTVDELLCRFYNWEIQTFPELHVKHLKPTGAKYDKTARYKQGEAFYRLGYDLSIVTIASLKLASKKGQPLLFIDYMKGYLKAKKEGKPLLVTAEQADFIRNYRWKKIKSKLF